MTYLLMLALPLLVAVQEPSHVVPPKKKAAVVVKKKKPLAPPPPVVESQPTELHLELKANMQTLSPPPPKSTGTTVLPITTGTGMKPIEVEGTSGSTERYTPSSGPGMIHNAWGQPTIAPGGPGTRF